MSLCVIKRDGSDASFDVDRIHVAAYKAIVAAGARETKADEVASKVAARVSHLVPQDGSIGVEKIQDYVQLVLMQEGQYEAATKFIVYRAQRAAAREMGLLFVNVEPMVEQYLGGSDWRIKENANSNFSLQGLNNSLASAITTRYWLHLLPEEVSDAHVSGEIHVHDLGIFAPYCCGWDLYGLLMDGFRGAPDKIECAPPKHFRTALGQLVNFIYTLQGEAAGAQAVSSFDTLLAPFVREDGLSYKEVKQAVQEFVFNCNVPTRVGFQCLSEDTEILTEAGWRSYDQVSVGDSIATFNLKAKAIEYLPAKRVFAREYTGKMYHLVNDVSDHLISPGHRVVRRLYESDQYVLDPIEDVIKIKSGPVIPLRTLGNFSGDDTVSEDLVRLAAWVSACGTQSEDGLLIATNQKDEVEGVLERLDISWRQEEQSADNSACYSYQLDAQALAQISEFFAAPVNVIALSIPPFVFSLSARLSKMFIDTYIKGAGDGEISFTAVNELMRDSLTMIAVNAGYCTICREEGDGAGSNGGYVISLIISDETSIHDITEVEYHGVIWCPNTNNETVIARRNGKVFITGNTPFFNLTLDVTPPTTLKDEPVLVGGGLLGYTYGDCQDEMTLINKALCEVLTEGDASGRPFTYPIPTYNIWDGTDWEDEEKWGHIWAMAAELGLPYFANFMNSDMSPEDVRSMCLAGDEPILYKINGVIKRGTMEELSRLVPDSDYDDEGWADAPSGLMALSMNSQRNVNWRPVSRLLRVYCDNSITVRQRDGKKYTVTSDHPVTIVADGALTEIPASALTGDEVVLSLNKCSSVADGTAVRVGAFELTPEFAWCAGMFASCGDILYSAVPEIALTDREHLIAGLQFVVPDALSNEHIIQKTRLALKFVFGEVEEAEQCYGNNYCFYIRDGQSARAFVNSGIGECGRLPNDLFNAPPIVIWSFLDGYFSGNSCVDKKNICLGDDDLSRDLAWLSLLAGYPLSGDKKEASFCPDLEGDEDVSFVPLQSVEKNDHEGKLFFDIELEDDHRFAHSLGSITHNCCRLRLDYRELEKRTGGLFGSAPLTGSIGVVTVNLANAAIRANGNLSLYWRNIDEAIRKCALSLVAKAKILENMTDNGLYPYSKFYLRGVKERLGRYWAQHFCTIGMIGAHEAAIELLGVGIDTKEGRDLAEQVLRYFVSRSKELSEEYGMAFNVEATPGEGAGYRLARQDAKNYPDSVIAKTVRVTARGENSVLPYTNSTQLPADTEFDLVDALAHQDTLQSIFTGGTVFHIFTGQALPSPAHARKFVRYVCENHRLPYITLSPVFSVCPGHGRFTGRHDLCPICEEECEVWDRVVGFYRPVRAWNTGKAEEFEIRTRFSAEAE